MNLTTVVVDIDSIVLKAYNNTFNPKTELFPLCEFVPLKLVQSITQKQLKEMNKTWYIGRGH